MALQNEKFIALSDQVKGRVEVVCWDVSDLEVVESLYAGIPVDEAVHFYSDEWERRTEQCISYVRARAGLFDRKVWARNCVVREVSKEDGLEFLEAFHIQGANRLMVIYFGLYTKGELLGLLSLGRHSRQIAENRIVLDRLCFRSGVQVVGGASKLLKAAVCWAKQEAYDELITFSDNRWTAGGLYQGLGFKLDSQVRRDYSYVRDGVRYSKQSQKKKTSKCPEGLTEFEWASYRGLKRIYDAGKKRWVLNLWPGVHRTRNERSSQRCAEMHHEGVFKRSHVRGYYRSDKTGTAVYYASSYELRCLFLLDQNPEVVAFRRCDAFEGAEGWRNPDVQVVFSDGHEEVWEIKPEVMLGTTAVQEQIRESKVYAEANGYGFRVWTERDSGLGTDHKIAKWAHGYLKGLGNFEYSERQKEGRRRIRQRHYAKVKADQVEVWCDYCQDMHTQLRLTYEKNLARNGRYICGRYGGHLAGRRPKDHLKVNNPYASEGEKQCTACQKVLPFEMFHKRTASWDGLNARCRSCVSASCKDQYRRRKVQGRIDKKIPTG